MGRFCFFVKIVYYKCTIDEEGKRMLFVDCTAGMTQFEGRNGHSWNGLPGFEDVRERIGNMICHGMLICTEIPTLAAAQIGGYENADGTCRATYDGRHVRVRVIWKEEYGSGEGKWDNLRRIYGACADLYYDVIHGNLTPQAMV